MTAEPQGGADNGAGWRVMALAAGGLWAAAGLGFDVVLRPKQLRMLAEFGAALPALTDYALSTHAVAGLAALPLVLAVVGVAARWHDADHLAVLLAGAVWMMALAGAVFWALRLPLAVFVGDIK